MSVYGSLVLRSTSDGSWNQSSWDLYSSADGNRQPGILVVALLVAILADLAVCLRFWLKRKLGKSLGWDDWTILAATLGISVGCALVGVQIQYGFGRHFDTLDAHQQREYMKYSWGEWIQTFATLMFTKISICFFLLRIAINKTYAYFLRGSIVFLVVSNVILTLLWMVQCRPDIEDAWQEPEAPGRCFSERQLRSIILAQAVISIVSDFVLAALPILILRKVQMSPKLKYGLCSLMGLGVMVSTGSICIVRTATNWQNINDDPTWHSVWNWHWRSWEVCIGVIVACIPTLRPGYLMLGQRIFQYTKSPVATTGGLSKEEGTTGRTTTTEDEQQRRGGGGGRAGPHNVEFRWPEPVLRPGGMMTGRSSNLVLSTCTSDPHHSQVLPMQGTAATNDILQTTTIDWGSSRQSPVVRSPRDLEREAARKGGGGRGAVPPEERSWL